MPEKLTDYAAQINRAGTVYDVSAWGEAVGGDWHGWLEFTPPGQLHATLRTPRETTQPDRDALIYWATGLEPVYFEGAFERALRSAAA